MALILALAACCIFIRRRRRHYSNPRQAAKPIPPPPWSPMSPTSPAMRAFSPDSNHSQHSFTSPMVFPVSPPMAPPTPSHTPPAELEAETRVTNHTMSPSTSSGGTPSTRKRSESPFWRLSLTSPSPVEMQVPTPSSSRNSWIRNASFRRNSILSHSTTTTSRESGVLPRAGYPLYTQREQREQPTYPQLQINFESLSESLELQPPVQPGDRQASPVPACLVPAAGTRNSQLPSPADSPLMSPERPGAESPVSQASSSTPQLAREGPRHSWRISASSTQAGSSQSSHRARLSKVSKASSNRDSQQ